MDGWVLHADIYVAGERVEQVIVPVVRREFVANARKLAARPRIP